MNTETNRDVLVEVGYANTNVCATLFFCKSCKYPYSSNYVSAS